MAGTSPAKTPEKWLNPTGICSKHRYERPQPAELRGIVVGSAIDGSLRAFIPDPTDLNTVDRGTSASGIAADAMGNIYAADVGAHKLRKYVRLR